MTANNNRIIAVTGATGLQGSAVTRHLLANGWRVRALTRDPKSEKAKALAGLGAEVVRGDMNQPDTLAPVFAGAYGVFSVQNPFTGGTEEEIRQGRNVAEAAKQAGVQHVVYSAAGPRVKGSNIPSWESKLVIEDHMKTLGLPLTVLRPTAFMELMTDKKFFPAVSTWHLMPKLAGASTKIFWIGADDLGAIAAKAFAEPGYYIGRELSLASDVKSIDECRAIYREVMGTNPPRFPMPAWIFKRFGFAGKDLNIMWRWLRTAVIDVDTGTTFSIHPGALNVRAWLEKQKSIKNR